MKLSFQLPDISATERFATKLASLVDRPITIALNGTLGAGKTQTARFLCQALGAPAEAVTSPTYVLMQRYRGDRFEIYHFDFYRLENSAQVWDLGFDELQESQAILLVEWAEKYPETLPADRLELQLTVPADENAYAQDPHALSSSATSSSVTSVSSDPGLATSSSGDTGLGTTSSGDPSSGDKGSNPGSGSTNSDNPGSGSGSGSGHKVRQVTCLATGPNSSQILQGLADWRVEKDHSPSQ